MVLKSYSEKTQATGRAGWHIRFQSRNNVRQEERPTKQESTMANGTDQATTNAIIYP